MIGIGLDESEDPGLTLEEMHILKPMEKPREPDAGVIVHDMIASAADHYLKINGYRAIRADEGIYENGVLCQGWMKEKDNKFHKDALQAIMTRHLRSLK